MALDKLTAWRDTPNALSKTMVALEVGMAEYTESAPAVLLTVKVEAGAVETIEMQLSADVAVEAAALLLRRATDAMILITERGKEAVLGS